MTSSSWQPVPGHLLTRWATEVDPACPLPEYPRPQMVRAGWVNLNGLWDYAIVPQAQQQVNAYEGWILVPFAVESALSGVGRPLQPEQRLWYRRTFANPLIGLAEATPGRRVLLHFGAVDYQCAVWINGRHMGGHVGGYLPFSFDITGALIEGDNELQVAVWDPSDMGLQQRGKQVLRPGQIWYTAVSGIWQTVWLEVTPARYIAGLKITPDLDARTVTVAVDLAGEEPSTFQDEQDRQDAFTAVDFAGEEPSTEVLSVEVYDGGVLVAEARTAGAAATLSIPLPIAWHPDAPHLYDLVIRAGDDLVTSYFAMRKFSLARAADGHLRFHLNNEPLFLYGPLDQGYFPDGLYTAPTDAALRFDVEYTKKIGANLIRKHVKVEPARWYYHCDRLGMLVWQDMPNGGRPVSNATTVVALALDWRQRDKHRLAARGRADEGNRRQYRAELQEMIAHLYNCPCIAAWVPFNEGWGQFQAREIAAWVKELDPTRSVDHASGWFDQGGGDYRSLHIYRLRLRERRSRGDGRAFVISEFGGYGLPVDGHVWDPEGRFSIRFFATSAELTEAYLALLENELRPLISRGLMAAIFTQTTDVEIEINGYLTYDRAVEKMPAERLAAAHRELYVLQGV